MRNEFLASTCLSLIVLLMPTPSPAAEDIEMSAAKIDQRSYRLGGIATFAEVVRIGIKRMALSATMSGEELDGLLDDARRIAAEAEVELYREPDFLVTDLFPLQATVGKQVLLIYRGATLEDYLALKRRKAALVDSDQYTGKAREEIAWELGRLLSYPDARIEELLKQNAGKEN